MKQIIKVTLIAAVTGAFLSSCEVMKPEEQPIRPTSENSDLAHGANDSSGAAALGGGVLSR